MMEYRYSIYLNRAKEFLSQEEIQFEDILMSIEKNRSETEKERMKAESYRLEIEGLKKELELQRHKINEQREKLLREAKEEARRLLLETRRETDELLKEMKRAAEEQEASLRNKAAEEVKVRLRTRINNVEESMSEAILPRQGYLKPPANLKPGDSVHIVNLNKKGTIVTPPDKDGEAIIQAGIMKINVHVTNLKLINEQAAAETHKVGSGKIGVSKSMSISTQVDIRGTNVDEAEEILDKFLDDAAIAGLPEVMVVHGKGTGALRSGVHQFLKANPRVKAFRLGKYGEGEAGVTVVELK